MIGSPKEGHKGVQSRHSVSNIEVAPALVQNQRCDCDLFFLCTYVSFLYFLATVTAHRLRSCHPCPRALPLTCRSISARKLKVWVLSWFALFGLRRLQSPLNSRLWNLYPS